MDTRSFTGMLLEAGASQVCIHGRSPVQRYGGSSDREVIIETASAFPGMVAGSGDVFCPRDAAELLEGGCAAVFVARGAFRDPFLIPVILDERGFDVDRKLLSHEPGSRIEMMLELGVSIVEEEGERVALLLLKRFLSGIFRGLRGASLFRRSIGTAANWRNMCDTLEEWKVFAERGEHLDR
jgi:tRNA-dihydrouridine synthase